tara:strand:+ start:238 stop:486 length:249 start_codon:yes stop_codon:yes gene_type:complete
MRINFILILIFILCSCSNEQSAQSEFDNSVCLEFAQQSGYPSAICDCVKEKTKEIREISTVTYENIEKLVNDCVQNNVGLGY